MPKFSLDVLRIPDFRLLLATRLFGTMAIQAQAVIVGWQIYSLTHDPFLLGLTGLVEAIPAVGCALVAGHIVDVSRPYRVLFTCIAVLTLNMLGFLLVGGGYLSEPGKHLLIWLYLGIFISGLARSFIIPSSFSLQPQIIPRALMPAASAWLTSAFQVGIIAGPAIAGLIYGAMGARAAWIMPASLMSLEFLVVCLLGARHRNFRSSQVREPMMKSIRAGWRFILDNPLLLSVMALDMFAVLFGGAVAMLPAYADQVLHIGSTGLGILRASPALGAVLVTVTLALSPMKKVRGAVLLWAVAGFGVTIIGLGLSHAFWLSLFMLALGGAFDSVSMVIRQTLVQWLTPDGMRGRVSSVNSMFIISSNEIGAFESGTAARLLGLVPSVVFGGVCTLVVVGVTALISPKLRQAVITAEPR